MLTLLAIAGSIITCLMLPLGLVQFLETRRQTKIALSTANRGKSTREHLVVLDELYRPTGAPDSFEDLELFRDIAEEWCPEMVVLPTGIFLMGSPEGEVGRFDDERPRHRVTISTRIAIGTRLVTFEQFDLFCGATNRDKPSDEGWGRGKRPVINVSWEDACAYTEWLSSITKKKYRLPTEAEWEYACRGNTTTKYNVGDVMKHDLANYSRSGKAQTTEVALYAENNFKIYDMHGNVWEWCYDGKRNYTDENQLSPVGPTEYSDYRVTRGGAWSVSDRYLRSAFRHSDSPNYRADDIGFRCARIIVEP